MNFQALVNFLNDKKVALEVADDQLKVNAAKGCITQDVANAITEHKAQLLEHVKSSTMQNQMIRVTKEEKASGVPLSFAQQRLWFINKLKGSNASYHVQGGFKLVGPLNVEALTRAFKTVIERHESLRTVFIERDGEPLQVVKESFNFALNIKEMASSKSEINGELLDEATKPFNLTEDLMLRILLIKQSENESLLLFTIHHIATDGWSVSVMLQELNSLYRAYNNNQINPLPELAFQYVDFANWQRNAIKDEALEKQQAYWKDTLADAPEVHSLPLDYPRPSRPSQDGALYQYTLDGELTTAIKDLCQSQQCTLFMLLQGAFALLLNRWSNEKDIVIGTPIANRTQAELFPLIGFFVNTLALRTRLTGNPSFIEYIQQVKANTLDAYANQDVPFDSLVETLNPARSESYTPLFQVMFSLQNNQIPDFDFDGLTFTPLAENMRIAKFDITLNIEDKDGRLNCDWEYNPKLFSSSTISALASAFEVLLSHITASPKSPVLSLPLVSVSQRQHMQQEASVDRQTVIDPSLSISGTFESFARKSPDAPAVISEQGTISYAELNAKANQLAHYLIQQGVVPGELVGVSFTRCPDLIVSILAILKVGGAYVPFDPNYPETRLTYMLKDSGVKVVLSQQAIVSKLPLGSNQQICICVDDIQVLMALLAKPVTDLNITDINTQSLAYINYTSGSTGQPKGVMVNQLGVLRLVLDAGYVALNEHTKMLQISSISFDATTFEVWGALLNGGQLSLYPSDYIDIQILNKLILQRQVNTLFITTALFEQWASVLDGSSDPAEPDWIGLQVLVGGEVTSPYAIQKMVKALPGIQVIHCYGPTENTTFTTCHTVSSDFDPIDILPIGKPINGVELWVLSSDLQILPDGAIGELCIGGAGLAKGYLNSVNIDQQKFIQHPYNDEPSARLYRSGDLVRKLPDGNFVFVSRADNQVKLRGFRIELGEIEACLSAHPDVAEALVMIREDAPGDRRLVAYVTTNGAMIQQADTELEIRLKSHVKGKLPDFMLPAAFVIVDKFSLNNNGKIDRSTLPAPTYANESIEYVAPETPTEEKLTQLWQSVLQLDAPVSVIGNFFHLGGHSLLATKLLAQISQEFNVELPVSTLFNTENLRQFAVEVDLATTLSKEDGSNPELIANAQQVSASEREEFEL
ncbi:amino acid adenylation domain-containing protein [Pseudoalteromonas sp. SCSIO 43210]